VALTVLFVDQAVGRDWVRDEKCVAFAMGLQDRLGGRSRVRPAFRCRANMAHISQSRPWLPGKSPQNVLRCSLFARQRGLHDRLGARSRVRLVPIPERVLNLFLKIDTNVATMHATSRRVERWD